MSESRPLLLPFTEETTYQKVIRRCGHLDEAAQASGLMYKPFFLPCKWFKTLAQASLSRLKLHCCLSRGRGNVAVEAEQVLGVAAVLEFHQPFPILR